MNFILSASALAAFKRCPKSYWFGYEKHVSMLETKEPIRLGLSFHEIAAAYARDTTQNLYAVDGADAEMVKVFIEWLLYRGENEFAQMRILHVEEPIFNYLGEGIELRTTQDLIYKDENDWIVIRDYKTFSNFPGSLDASLDFQARIYIAAVMLKYKTSKVKFEHVYIRRDLFHSGKQSNVRWTPAESYVYEEIVISSEEARALWAETMYVASLIANTRDIMRSTPSAWYRVDLKGTSPFTCGSCFYKNICHADLAYGFDGLDLESLGYKIEETERNSSRTLPGAAPT